MFCFLFLLFYFCLPKVSFFHRFKPLDKFSHSSIARDASSLFIPCWGLKGMHHYWEVDLEASRGLPLSSCPRIDRPNLSRYQYLMAGFILASRSETIMFMSNGPPSPQYKERRLPVHSLQNASARGVYFNWGYAYPCVADLTETKTTIFGGPEETHTHMTKD